MLEQQNILEIKGLSVNYISRDEVVKAVDNIYLKIKKGEALGIIGESGCGKSSLALAIMNLIKEGKVTGKVLYKDIDLLELSERNLKRYRWQEIAIVFQNSLNVLNPVLTIKEQMSEAIKTHINLSGEEIDRKVTELMGLVGLDSRWKESYPHQLSGGMRQRVLIAMALTCNPELLIVDEPTASLDRDSKAEIINLLNNLKKKYKFTMVLISHNMNTIRQLTSRLITMYKGRFVEIGLTDEVIENPAHCYTRGLLNSSPELFPYKDLWGIKGSTEMDIEKGCAFFPRCPQSSKHCQEKKPELEYVAVERKVACNKGGIITLLEARGINKSYILENGDYLQAVKNVGINVHSGEVAALVGKSGSGKSTLAHVLVGVLKNAGGEVYFRGNKINDNRATKMIGGMQIVFQDPFSATSDRLSVLEVITEPLNIIKWKDPFARKEKAISLLKEVQLPTTRSFLNRLCQNLSGGQRQRVAIARSLVTDPRLLVADEITSMLDPSIQANVIRKLKELQNNKGFSMLYITHNIELARKIADKVYVMEDGQIIIKGNPSDVFYEECYIYERERERKDSSYNS
ncbi:MAG: ABC transporter ATP-binding protein [Halanaerobiaceae bacterium]